MTVNDELAARILDGLRHCLPETGSEAALSCGKCPYCKQCIQNTDHDAVPVSMPIAMIRDIRRLLTVTAVQ